MPAQGAFECYGHGKLLIAVQALPGRDVRNCGDYDEEEGKSGEYGQKNGNGKIPLFKARTRLFRYLSHRFKT